MSENLVSVLMLTYGQEAFIGKAIDSVLTQHTDFDFELVICNDCSPDSTDLVIRQYIESHAGGSRIRYYNHKKNLGFTTNFLYGVERCAGEYLAICDGDDFYSKNNHLQLLYDHFKFNPDFGFVTTTYINYYSDSRMGRTYKKKHSYYVEDIFGDRPFHVSSSLYRKSDIDDLVDFSKTMNDDKFFIDKNIMLVCAKEKQIGLIDNLSFTYRYQNGVTNSKRIINDALISSQKYGRQLSIINRFNIGRNMKDRITIEMKISTLINLPYPLRLYKGVRLMFCVLRLYGKMGLNVLMLMKKLLKAL